ncbi:NAP1- protein 2 [Saguinus oedipus]|uniref:NAP1- protein 2 n=1 Tax=Saguinus oedipus TaxID=9490 RepID=A0ABQ9VHE2_SAGOE|nr:NAP1- protein 2 [Saguinus oedipus]
MASRKRLHFQCDSDGSMLRSDHGQEKDSDVFVPTEMRSHEEVHRALLNGHPMDIPEIHDREGYEDEIDGEYGYDLADSPCKTQSNTPFMGKSARLTYMERLHACNLSRILCIVDEYEVDWSNSSSATSGSGTPSTDKEKNWLYTLDPILITIIAMSSLGVLLGATCAGLLLYCTCSYSGLSSRSCTTLENYNFELYDGLKHKVKMNHQKCCSEA